MPNNKKQVYEKKTPREHVLLRPDMYIGSVTPETKTVYILNDEKTKMEEASVTYIPGLLKIFDEILVNALDNKQRDKSMSFIKVTANKATGKISVENDGKGIPVEKHEQHRIYIPEMIFGQMLTSSNFDDSVKRVVGGRNGYGAKLTNIFSLKFVVETGDGKRHFKQTHSGNMTEKTEPEIRAKPGRNFTKISFVPDYKRFGLAGLNEDCFKMIERRVFDMAGVSDRSVKVKFNGAKLPVNGFKDYLAMFLTPSMPILHLKVSDRWEIGVSLSDGHFRQVSYVNGIGTKNGGRHADYVADIVAKYVAGKKKDLKPRQVKDFMFLFVNCLIENPAFKSQTKDELTTKTRDFGSKCEIPESFLKRVAKSQIAVEAVEMVKHKDLRNRARKTDGKKTSKIFGIAKLTDARHAGTKKSEDCTLILVEGDSAKTLALAGLPSLRDTINQHYYGIYPLKGKVLNVRDANTKQIANNPEITNIKKILGLKERIDYSGEKNYKQLRYGKLMIMVDQDFDGSHIKGLLINLFHLFWPSLLKRKNFLYEFITPIVICRRKNVTKEFFTIPEYEEWKLHADTRKFSIKYYKGLGTSSNAEAERYFSNLGRHQVRFKYSGQEDDEAIVMAFSKAKAEARKEWLSKFVPGTFLDHDGSDISYNDFIHKELILFSMADNLRSIPSLVDGLKPGQRKILFSCLKRNVVKDAKIPQLAGFVMSDTAYHHGDMALQGTIIKMAQRFVGSNNVNLLEPVGQFGSRSQGGKDAANARYISTRLAGATRCLFHREDDAVLKHLDDDGIGIEPEWFVPTIPTVLVNGSEGIGTGWSTSVPCYNPKDLIRAVKAKLDGEEPQRLHPWYRNWKGSLRYIAEKNSYAVVGKVELLDEHNMRITELPINVWTETYKVHLAKLMEVGVISNIFEEHSVDGIDFTVETSADNPVHDISEFLLKTLKLTGNISMSNMVLFTAEGKLKRYASPLQILDDFYAVRLEFYDKRKKSIVKGMELDLKTIKNKARFISEIVSKKLKVLNRPKREIFGYLKDNGYDLIFKDTAESTEEHGFDYLLSMAIWTLTNERFEKLKREAEEVRERLETYRKIPIKTLWRNDLDALDAALDKFWAESDKEKTKKKSKAKRAKKLGKGKVNQSQTGKKGFFKSGSGKAGLFSKMITNEEWGEEDLETQRKRKTVKSTPFPKKPKIVKTEKTEKPAAKSELRDSGSAASSEKENKTTKAVQKKFDKSKLVQKNIENFAKKDWECSQCTFENNWDAETCDICGSERSEKLFAGNSGGKTVLV